MKTSNAELGKYIAAGEVRIVRILPGPIERVWDFLTDPQKRACWFAGGPMDLRPGGKVTLHYRHKNLSPNESPPEEYRDKHEVGGTMEGHVTRCDPPRLLAFTFALPEVSEAIFELTPQGDAVQLVLTHRARSRDFGPLPNFAAGWHSHLLLLEALLENQPLPPFWANHTELLPQYQKLRAATHFP